MAGAFELPPLEPVVDVRVSELEHAISAARAEADAIREQARAEGLAAGLEEARSGVEAAVAALAAAGQGLEDERADIAARTETAAVELAFAVAEQILGAALEVDPGRVVDVVRGGLRRLVEREHVTILVHPDDLDLVREAAPGLVTQLGGIDHLEVQAERRVSRGGAVVRTGEGEVDASLATKLEHARAVVVAALRDGDATDGPDTVEVLDAAGVQDAAPDVLDPPAVDA
jgi:flagellar assembly protein FliH